MFCSRMRCKSCAAETPPWKMQQSCGPYEMIRFMVIWLASWRLPCIS